MPAPAFSTVLIPVLIGISRATAALLARDLDIAGSAGGITTLGTLFSLALLAICALYCLACLALTADRGGVDIAYALATLRQDRRTWFALLGGVAAAAENWLLLWAASAHPECQLEALLVAYTLAYVISSLLVDCFGLLWAKRRLPQEGALVGCCFLVLGGVLLFTLTENDRLARPSALQMFAGAGAGLAGLLAFALTHRASQALCSYWAGTTVTAVFQGLVFVIAASALEKQPEVLRLFRGKSEAVLWTVTLIGVVFGFAGVQFYCDESGFFPTCGALTAGAVCATWIIDAARGHTVTWGKILGLASFTLGGIAMWTRKPRREEEEVMQLPELSFRANATADGAAAAAAAASSAHEAAAHEKRRQSAVALLHRCQLFAYKANVN